MGPMGDPQGDGHDVMDRLWDRATVGYLPEAP